MANTTECAIAWNDISNAFGLTGQGPKDEFESSTIGKLKHLLISGLCRI